MRKIIGAINMTLDGFCDHTAISPDEEIHQHYTDLINVGDVILYGRITYELMKFWPSLVKNPSGDKSLDDFALAIDKIPKIVFSTTLENTGWHSAKLTSKTLEEKVMALKQSNSDELKNILVGSRSLIVQLMTLDLLDELQLCIHPVAAGDGMHLFEHLGDRKTLRLTKTKVFGSGAILLYYDIIKENE